MKYLLKSFIRPYKNIGKYLAFKKQLQTFKVLAAKNNQRFTLDDKNLIVSLNDNTENTEFDRHYIYHPAWATRIVKAINPAFHIDISSTLHFCSTLSAFIPVRFYDYRPAKLILDNLSCHAGDLNNLAFESGSVESISCMHTIEHIGLGRYGDPLDYDGDLQALKELKRVVKKQGHLLIVVPVAGEAKICFNGHRVYSPEMIINFFKDDFQLKEFALIPEDEKDGGLIINPDSDIISKQNYGCGCFWFQKN